MLAGRNESARVLAELLEISRAIAARLPGCAPRANIRATVRPPNE